MEMTVHVIEVALIGVFMLVVIVGGSWFFGSSGND